MSGGKLGWSNTTRNTYAWVKVPEKGMAVNDGSLVSQPILLGVAESGSANTVGLWSIAFFISVGTTVLLGNFM
jgi:hypothetical protein